MFFGRLLGWALLGLAMLMASGDAVLALGPGDHVGIVTGDVWMLLAGRAFDRASFPPSIGSILMAWPAWTVIAPIGLALLLACRRRRRRYRFRRIG